MLTAPARDWNVFKQIFADHWKAFRQAHPRYQTPYYEELVAKMLACGNPKRMGYVAYRCLHGGQGSHGVSMRCQSSLCLRCAIVSADTWGSQVSKALHEGVISRHILLTVPALVRPTCYHNAGVLVSGLMRCGAQCLDEVWSVAKPCKAAPVAGSAPTGAMASTIRTCICWPPVAALIIKANAGSMWSICPMGSCDGSGSGTC